MAEEGKKKGGGVIEQVDPPPGIERVSQDRRMKERRSSRIAANKTTVCKRGCGCAGSRTVAAAAQHRKQGGQTERETTPQYLQWILSVSRMPCVIGSRQADKTHRRTVYIFF